MNHIKPWQERMNPGDNIFAIVAAMEQEVSELRELVKFFSNAVEELAFKMPPPNAYTPQFVQMAITARALAH